jgi:hypothetical protein
MADQRIDFSRNEESEGVSHQVRPERETRPQSEKERAPDTYRRNLENEGRSDWSGGSWGGRSR